MTCMTYSLSTGSRTARLPGIYGASTVSQVRGEISCYALMFFILIVESLCPLFDTLDDKEGRGIFVSLESLCNLVLLEKKCCI